MIRKNEEYVVDIIDNGYKGEGIAKIDGITVFIDNAISGEKVKIKILKVLKNQAYGKIIEIIKKSKNRTNIDCESFNQCGGCDLRHMSYQETLKLKKSIVENNLQKVGLEYVKVKECIGMEKPFNYRNKLQYPVGIINGKPEVGVFAKRSHRIIPTNNCLLQNKLSQKVVNDVFEFMLKNNISVYDEEKNTGEIRHIYVRIGTSTNEVMLVLVTNKENITKEKELTKFIISKYPEIKTVVKNINNKNTNVILGNRNKVLYGSGYIIDKILGFTFKISAMSFYQVNSIQTEKLYSTAITQAKLTGKETIFDLYCGIGTIGICASKYVQELYGIETVPEAIEDAKENIKLNGIKNAKFLVGNVEDELPKLIQKENIKPDVIFIDPPRKGCEKTAIQTLLELQPEKIVYISCNPATLARDLKLLEVKYAIKEIQPVDMFPWTAHVECVSVLHRKTLEK